MMPATIDNDEAATYERDWADALEPDGTYRTETGETMTYSGRGEPKWLCSGCPTMFVYVEHPSELEHSCEEVLYSLGGYEHGR